MPYTSLQDVIDDINLRIVPNNHKDIDAQELQDILKGMIQFMTPTLIADLTVKQGSGGSVGGSDDGEVFTEGTGFEDILRDMLIKLVHPTYVAPTTSLTSTVSTSTPREVGAQISPQLNSVFTQNNGGDVLTKALKKNGTTIATVLPFTDTNATIPDEGLAYQASIAYGQGPVLNNNLGDADTVGRINAGTILSNIITYTAQRKSFFGTGTAAPTTSAGVRALSGAILGLSEGASFLIPIPSGAEAVIFAYPATLKDPANVLYVEYSNGDIKELFTKTTVNVQGANSYTAIPYKVFTYIPLEPWQEDTTFKVII